MSVQPALETGRNIDQLPLAARSLCNWDEHWQAMAEATLRVRAVGEYPHPLRARKVGRPRLPQLPGIGLAGVIDGTHDTSPSSTGSRESSILAVSADTSI